MLTEESGPQEIVEAMCAPCDAETYQRLGTLLARLIVDAEDVLATVLAAVGEGRYAAVITAEGSVVNAAAHKTAAELTKADARSYACMHAALSCAWGRCAPAGMGEVDPSLRFATGLIPFWAQHEPMRVVLHDSPELPVRMAELLVELTTDLDEDPIVVCGGLWAFIQCGGWGGPVPQQKLVVRRMWDMGWFGSMLSRLQALQKGSDDWLSVQPGTVGTVGQVAMICSTHLSRFFGSELEPAVRSFIATSGLFQLCCEAVTEYSQRPSGTTSLSLIYFAFRMMPFVVREPGCADALRALAPAIAFGVASDEVSLRNLSLLVMNGFVLTDSL